MPSLKKSTSTTSKKKTSGSTQQSVQRSGKKVSQRSKDEDFIKVYNDLACEWKGQKFLRDEDMCQVGTLCMPGIGIPRYQMPQITSVLAKNITCQYGAMRHQPTLKNTVKSVLVSTLRPAQGEIQEKKVNGIVGAYKRFAAGESPTNPLEGGDLPVVSLDNVLLDGHHRWGAVAKLMQEGTLPSDYKLKVTKLPVPAYPALLIAASQPNTKFKSGLDVEVGIVHSNGEMFCRKNVNKASWGKFGVQEIIRPTTRAMAKQTCDI